MPTFETSFTLPPLRNGIDAPATLRETRARLETAPSIHPIKAGIQVGEVVIEGIKTLVVTPASPKRSILYFHGGGFRLGQPAGWAGYASQMASLCDARFIIPDYRLAPENPFPAALHDGTALFRHFRDLEHPLYFAGDSAGGGVAASMTLAVRESGARMPDGLILLSPWLDLTISGETFETRKDRDAFFPRASATEAAEQYLQGHPADDPLVSPLLADLHGFPPTLLFAGGEETLLADSTRFAGQLALAGVDSEAHFMAGMQHVWPVIFPDLAETAHAFSTIARFVDRIDRKE